MYDIIKSCKEIPLATILVLDHICCISSWHEFLEKRTLKRIAHVMEKNENWDTIILWKTIYYINIDNYAMRNFYCEQRVHNIRLLRKLKHGIFHQILSLFLKKSSLYSSMYQLLMRTFPSKILHAPPFLLVMFYVM